MTSIRRADENDAGLLSALAGITFIESHGHSAPAADVDAFKAKTYNENILKKELSDPKNIYHIMLHNDKSAGYSRINLDSPYEGSEIKNLAKLDRLYILMEIYDLHLGSALFGFILGFLKENNQKGVWLYTWKKNQRAIDFYERKGFVIIGSYDFKISETHSNTNHQMLLRF